MFKIDDKELLKYEKDLKTFASRAFPFATKNTLNTSAFKAQKIIKADLPRDFTIRNTFTARSVQVEQAKTLNVSRQAAVVGSTADYMEKQEFGGSKSKRGKEGVPIPTAFAAGQSESEQPRTRVPRKRNALRTIQLRNRRVKAKNNRQALLLKVQEAVRSGNRFFFHEFDGGRSQGIYKVIGGRKSFKRGWPTNARIKMVYDLSRQTVTNPPKPWLKPAVDEISKLMPLIHRDSLVFQLRRLGLFQDG